MHQREIIDEPTVLSFINKLSHTIYDKFGHLILYGIIGASCAALDFCVYTILVKVFSAPYLLANVVSIHCGIICSFFLNRSYNFRVKDKTKRRFLTFYAVGLIGLCISEVLLYVLVNMGGWNEVACKLVTIVLVAIVQFLLNKYVTFKTREK